MGEIKLSRIFDKKFAGLVWTMVHRDIVGKYNGSIFGFFWSLFNPLFLLSVYTFAFGFIFKARWGAVGDNPFDFALALFPALLVFNYFSDCVNRAPSLITGNPAYVKKVVFPLEVLPIMSSLSALFNFLIGIFVWVIAYLFIKGQFNFSVFWMILIIPPLVIFTIGISIFLSALGVYLRDVQQVIGVFTSALIFMSPVFYSLESIPEKFRVYIEANPLTHFVELSRGVMFSGNSLDVSAWLTVCLTAVVTLWVGVRWFNFTRKGFADVL